MGTSLAGAPHKYGSSRPFSSPPSARRPPDGRHHGQAGWGQRAGSQAIRDPSTPFCDWIASSPTVRGRRTLHATLATQRSTEEQEDNQGLWRHTPQYSHPTLSVGHRLQDLSGSLKLWIVANSIYNMRFPVHNAFSLEGSPSLWHIQIVSITTPALWGHY